MNRTLKTGLWVGIPLVVVGMQLWPVERTNPPVTREIHWVSPATAEIARGTCYDCHSNETQWPWYAYVAPVSWWVTGHVDHARGHLNFSEWDGPNEDAEEILEMVESGEMPLPSYLPMHPEARLSEEEKEALLAGLRATLEADPPREGG